MDKMTLSIMFALGLIQTPFTLRADYIPTPGTQGALSKGACDQYKEEDRKLNEVYQAILRDNAYVGKADFLQAFKAAERNWIAYRDAELEALFPGSNKQSQWGSVY